MGKTLHQYIFLLLSRVILPRSYEITGVPKQILPLYLDNYYDLLERALLYSYAVQSFYNYNFIFYPRVYLYCVTRNGALVSYPSWWNKYFDKYCTEYLVSYHENVDLQ